MEVVGALEDVEVAEIEVEMSAIIVVEVGA